MKILENKTLKINLEIYIEKQKDWLLQEWAILMTEKIHYMIDMEIV